MKSIAVLLSFSLLLLGCYSQAPLVRNELPPADAAVAFYLTDGSRIESKAGEHVRRDGAYDVAGFLYTPAGTEVRFKGVLRDADIQKVTAEHVDVVRSSIAAALGGIAVFALLLLIGGTIELVRP